MNNSNKIAYCGLYCGACRIYLSTLNNTLETLSDETGIPVQYLECNGCRSEVTSLYCRNCAMKKCNLQKQIFSCNECEEFPCSVLKAFENDQHPHHKGIIDSLKQLKILGKNNWINEKEKRWSCTKCGNNYSWYELKCINCENELDGLKRT
jgi:hypothetical protein